MFTAFKLTNNGKALHIGAVNGNSIKFTKVAFGDGVEKTNYLEATELSNVVTSVPFTSYDNTKQNILNLKWELDTSKIPKSFDWCEYGLYAEDKDGNEVLYAYAYDNAPARLEKMEQGVIALYVGYVTVTITDTDDITVAVGDYDTVTVNQFKEHTENYENPHNVTAQQIGLGNVENVSPSDAIPEFAEESRFLNINSGETSSVLWGKVKKAISTLSNHLLDKNNPHNVIWRHIFSSSNEALPVEYGGTGVSSLSSIGIEPLQDYKSQVTFGAVFYNFYNCQFYRKNGIVTVTVTCQINKDVNGDAQAGDAILTLPVGMRPANQLSVIGIASNKEIFTVAINPDGQAIFYSFGSLSIPQATHIRFSATYPAVY